MVTAMDEAVGNITSVMKEVGIFDDTIIIFSADVGSAHVINLIHGKSFLDSFYHCVAEWRSNARRRKQLSVAWQ